MIISPADHLIVKEQRFSEIVQAAIDQANKGERLVTLGILPSRPDTGYGYIEVASKIEAGAATEVLQFREKPNLKTAQGFLDSGNFYWNSGLFVWKAATILSALKQFQPALHALFAGDLSDYNSTKEQEKVNHCFEVCEDISIDFAVMEHAKNTDVVLADFDWSDLGTWGSLSEHLTTDANNNSVIGQNAFLFNSKNCQVNVPNDKLVLIDGLEDYIVVESDNMLMILKNENEQELKNYLKHIDEHKA
jgi:mannose-1-phosphate guanylyltransferase